jgi:hypothetical protein
MLYGIYLRRNLVTNRTQLNYTMHKKMCKMAKKIIKNTQKENENAYCQIRV